MSWTIDHMFLIFCILLLPVDGVEVPKCCPQGYLWLQNCTSSNNSLVNPYLPENGQESIHQPLDCGIQGSYYLDPLLYPKSDAYQLLENSSLFLNASEIVLSPQQYCMELINSTGKVQPVLCFAEEAETVDRNENTYGIYSFGMIISIPFLLVTFIVYLLERDLQTLHGRCMTNHVFALLMSYVCLGYLQQFTTSLSESACTFLGFSVQYFFLATFFWLNVMCIDIYWAFSSVRTRGGRPGGDLRKLLLYSLYAWGMPLLILLATVAVDFSDAVPKMSPFKPNVGTNKCFFEGRSAAYLYFYGPMALLICANMVLFGVTAYRIWSTSRETAALNRGDSRRHSDKQENERFKLYVKLFLVMGINWAAELISFIVGEGVPHYLWYVTDLTNTLQGVFIFIIFVWKRRVRFALKTALCNKFTRGSTSSTISRKTISSRL
uniref:Putative class b secretin-like g-protein coupled receptor gprmth1 n=1 Tax=Rhodnius prolixus TaxID=13249 RepID=R4FKF4_RHOPR